MARIDFIKLKACEVYILFFAIVLFFELESPFNFIQLIIIVMSSLMLSKTKEIQHTQKQEQSSSVRQTLRPTLYFHSILCNPYLLENPSNSQHSFMQDLFRNKQIKKVRRTKDYLSVDLVERPISKTQKQIFPISKCDVQKQLQASYKSVDGFFKTKKLQNNEQIENFQFKTNQYYQNLEQVKDKSVICWFIPFCDKGIKLRSFSISASLIKILQYNIDDLAIDIQLFGAQAIDLIDGQIYKTSFLLILNMLKKLQYMKDNGDITKEQIFKESQTIITNEIKGKRNKKISVETKISLLSENLVCFQIIKILDKKQVKDHQRRICRQNTIDQLQRVAFNCLQKVAKLPKSVDPSNSAKICSYVEIRPNRSSKEYRKMMNQ